MNKKSKKIFAVVLSFVMVLGLVPAMTVNVNAADPKSYTKDAEGKDITVDKPFKITFDDMFGSGSDYNLDGVGFSKVKIGDEETPNAHIFDTNLCDTTPVDDNTCNCSAAGGFPYYFKATQPGTYSFTADTGYGTNLCNVQITVTGGASPAPVASNVSINGITKVGNTLTGSYSVTGGSGTTSAAVQWYQADDSAGTTNKTKIGTANSNTYTITSNELGKYIIFEVTPKAGTTNGTAVTTVTAQVVDKVEDDFTYSNVAKNYGDGTFTHTVTGGSGTGAVSYTSSDTSVATINSLTGGVTIVGAGNTTLTATRVDDSNYKQTSKACTLTVNKKSLTATATANSKVYDGSTAASGSITLTGVINSDEVAASGSFAFANKNAGSGKTVNVTGITLSGAKAGNYSLSNTNTSTTADITAKSLRVTATAASKAYDGNTTATGSINLTGIISPDVVTASGTFTFDSATAGTGKTVNVSGITLFGVDAVNYSLGSTTASTTADITKLAQAAVTYNDITKTYGDSSFIHTASGGSVGSFAYNSSDTSVATINSSTGEVTIVGAGTTTLTATKAGDANNEAASDTCTLTVNKAALTATIGNYSKTYGDTNPAFTVAVTGFVKGETAATAAGYTSPTASCTADTTTGVGDYQITISGGAANNYTFDTTDTGTLSITKRELIVSASANSKVYDGSTAATGSIGLTGVINSDEVVAGGSFAFANKYVGTGKTLNVTGITLSGAKAGNYSLSLTTTSATADITPKNLNVTVSANSKAYDGTATATGSISLVGVISPDVVTARGTFAFDSATAGTGKTVNVTGITLVGVDAVNYSLGSTTASTTADITKLAQAAVTYNDITKTYGDSSFIHTASGGSVGSFAYNSSDTSVATINSSTGEVTIVGAGTTTLTATKAGDANNEAASDTCTLTVNKAALTATIGNYSKTYGDTNPAFTVAVTGFVKGETAATAAGYTSPTASCTADTTTGVGDYQITISGGAANNYTFDTTDTGTLSITKRELIVSASANSKVYDGSTAATGSIGLTGVINSDEVVAGGSFAFANKYVGTGKTLNVTGITLSGAKAGNYSLSLTTTSATADITPKNLNVTVSANSKAYDGTATATGSISLVGVISPDVVTARGTFAFDSATAGTGKTVNVTGITLVGVDAVNYSLGSTTASTTADITKLAQAAVTYNDITKTYGDSSFIHTASGGSVGSFAYNSSDTSVATINSSTGEVTIVGAGTTTLTATKAGDANNEAASDTCTLTVNKAALTATIGNYSKTYGDTNPAFTVAVTGFVKGETAATAAGYTSPTASCTADTTTGVGDYQITISGGAANNYTFDTTDTGTLSITKRELIVSASANSKVYDGSTAATGSIGLTGVINSDEVVAGGSFAFANKYVGTGKTLNVTGITLSGAKAGNYSLSLTTTSATADITAKNLGVTATAVSKVYDGNTTATGSINLTGIISPDVVSVSGIFAFESATAGTNKTVNVTGITLGGADAGNYSIGSTTASTTADITKLAQAAVTYNDITKTYGDSSFIHTATGGSGTGTFSYTSSDNLVAEIDSLGNITIHKAGTATLTAFKAGDSNYEPASDMCTIKVNKAPLTATVDNYTNTYGDTNPMFTVSVTGFVNGDTAATAAGYTLPTASCTADKTTDAGDYQITLSGGTADNYTFDTTDKGTLSITKRQLTVTASANNKAYDGNTLATGNVSLSGIISPDVVTASGIFAFESATAGTNKTVNVTGITLGGADAGNYSISSTTTSTTADITKLTQTAVKYDDITKTYGDSSFTHTANGGSFGSFAYSSSDTSVATINSSTGEVTIVGAGTTTLIATKAGDTNHEAASDNCTLTVNKAALTATIGNYSKTYGDTNPAFTVAVTGFVNGDTALNAAGYSSPSASCTADATTGIGDYQITISGGAAANYTFDITDKGTLSINKKILTATASAISRVYDGSTAASGSIGLTGIVNSDVVTANGSFAFTDKTAGTGKTVKVSGIILSGTKVANYSLSNTTASAIADITEKNVGVTVKADSKEYDGNTTATGNVSLSGIISPDVVTASGIFAFDSATVGAGKTVNVAGITLGGTDAGNYSLGSTTASTTADITKQAKSIAVTTLPSKLTYEYGEAIDPTGGIVTVTYTDNSISTEALTSPMCSVATSPAIGIRTVTVINLAKTTSFNVTYVKAHQAAPATPTCTVSALGITVTEPTGIQYEYTKDGGATWQSDTQFTGLTHNTAYTVQVRLKETETLTASAISSGTTRTFLDITAPVLAAGTVSRTGDTTCSVSFTSGEAGTYYYGIVTTGTSEPVLSTSGSGISCSAGAITFNPALTSGAKDIYIVVKDAAGNVSNKIKLTIPAYVAPSSGGSSTGSNPAPTVVKPEVPAVAPVIVIVNNKEENIGNASTQKENNKTVTTITVDEKALEEKLKAEGDKAVVIIPVNNDSDVKIGELNGQMVKNMETQKSVIEVKTQNAAYTLPAQQINIDAVSKEIGKDVTLKDIKVRIEISQTPTETVKVVENSAKKGELTIIAPPVDFHVTCTTENKTVEVKNFNSYVERRIAIPAGVDPKKVTTGVVVDADGTVRHMPTKIEVINGVYYATINSLTNSTYSVVWHPLEFKDVEKHWAKDAINDMGSRLVIEGVSDGIYEPDRDITRAEFCAIVIRALGLKPGIGNNTFTDVKSTQWYCDYIKTAIQYNIISGYGNGKFGPMDKITREQAMAMVSRAMKITGLKIDLKAGEAEKLLVSAKVSGKVTDWAKDTVATCIKAGIIPGKDDKLTAPKENISRAEVAVIIRKLLQKSNLI